MAFFADLSDGEVKVISRKDRAIEDVPSEDYDKYLASLDESFLNLQPGQPVTRFVMRKILPYKSAMKVKNQQVSIVDGEMRPQLSFMSEEVRLSLTNIENPAVEPDKEKFLLKFKRENDGGAAFQLMSVLEAAGVVNDLYTARQNAVGSTKLDGIDKKK